MLCISFLCHLSSPSRQPQRLTDWCNSPNSYLKQEIEETGTPNPKKVTKVRLYVCSCPRLRTMKLTFKIFQWVPDTSSKHSTPIKIDTKHQFAPSNIDPKELKSHQKQIKEDRFNEKISAGYQSKIFQNSAWDDVSQIKVIAFNIYQSSLISYSWLFSRIHIKQHRKRLLSLVRHPKVSLNAINKTMPWFTNLIMHKIHSHIWIMTKSKNTNETSNKIKCVNKVCFDFLTFNKHIFFHLLFSI